VIHKKKQFNTFTEAERFWRDRRNIAQWPYYSEAHEQWVVEYDE